MERQAQLYHHQQAVVQGTGSTHTEWKELGLKLGLTPCNHPHGSQKTQSSCRTYDTRKALPPKQKARYCLPSLGFLWSVVSSKFSHSMEWENLELTTDHRNPREGRQYLAFCLGGRAFLVS